MLCQKCGAIVPAEIQYCQNCGNDMFAQTVAVSESGNEPTVAAYFEEKTALEERTVAAYAQPAYQQPQPPKKKNKGIIIGFAVLSVIAVAAIVVAVLFGTGVIGKDDKDETPITEHQPAKKTDQGEIAIQIGDIAVTEGQFDYYYNMSYHYFAQMESSYQQQGMSMGFPLDKAPDEVAYGKDDAGNDIMFDQAIADYAANLAYQQFAIYYVAKYAESYYLLDEEKAEIDEVMLSLEEQAEENGFSLDEFIKFSYSEKLDEEGLRELLEIELIATRYHDDIKTAIYDAVVESEVEAAYNANPEKYASYTGNVADVRHCLFLTDKDGDGIASEAEKKAAHEKAELAMQEWTAAGATEEAFIDIVTKYNDDTASTEIGGLYEGITSASNYVDGFKNWAIDPARRAGDCQIIETEYGYHIMYFVSFNGPAWYSVVEEELQEKAYTEWFETNFGENGKYTKEVKQDIVDACAKKFCDKFRSRIHYYTNLNTLLY